MGARPWEALVTRKLAHAVSALLACLALLPACATNPATGERQLVLVSEAQEVALGQQYAPQVVSAMGLVQDDALQAYVERVGLAMARASERPDIPWQFRVVDDPVVNAFALPGGPIFVTRGILAHMSSEAELASVLGHEIGHVTARHSVDQMSKQQLAQIGLGVGMILAPPALRGLGQVGAAGLQVLFLKYGRDDERQADDLGLRYMTARSYDAREMVEMFRTLGRTSAGGEGEGGEAGPPAWLSTHPNPADRERTMLARIREQGLGEGRVGREEFLRAIDGLVYGENPREGFFRGARYHHPDLRFRMDFPEGWKTQNQREAVVGVSPQQDAAVLVTGVEHASAEQAARSFFSQQGVQERGAQRTRIGGSAAVVGEFAAATQQGTLEGLVAFVEHRERVYRLLGFGPSRAYDAWRDVIGRSLSSFAAETDPSILAIEPRRIRIVTPTRPLGIDAFAKTYPGPVPASELALLNRISPGGSYPPGIPVKRIVGE
jgi:predicted Zn-dependent protease